MARPRLSEKERTENRKKSIIKYNSSEKGKATRKKATKKYRDTHKEIIKVRMKRHYQKHKERERKKALEYHYKNRDKRIKYKKEWAKKNKKHIEKYGKDYYNKVKDTEKYKSYREGYMKRYYKENKEKVDIVNKEYYNNNKDKCKLCNEKYRKNNKDKFRLYNKKYAKNNPEKIKSQNWKRRLIKSKAVHKFTLKEWKQKLKNTLGVCPYCNKYEGINKLHLDHIYPLNKAYQDYLKTGIKRIYTISDIQPLCKSCNSSKGINEVKK